METLRRIWRRMFKVWMMFAETLGRINSAILLSVVYLAMVVPMKLLWSIIGKDPLFLRRRHRRNSWQSRDPEPPTLEERSHPF